MLNETFGVIFPYRDQQPKFVRELREGDSFGRRTIFLLEKKAQWKIAMLKCKLLSHYYCIHAYYSWWPFSLSAYPFCCCFSQENGREVLKFLGLNVTQILTAFMATLHFEVLACIDFWSRKEGKKVDDEGSPPPPRGCKINETGMSGFTVCLVTNETGISRTHTSDLVEKKPRNRWAHCLKMSHLFSPLFDWLKLACLVTLFELWLT